MQKNHVYIIIIALIIVAVAGYWLWGRVPTQAPTLDTTAAGGAGAGPDTTSAIEGDLQAASPVADIDAEFQAIDEELNKL